MYIYIYGKKVWRKVSREASKRQGWKITKTRGIDINKGDSDNPDIRNRLVGKEFNNGDNIYLLMLERASFLDKNKK